MTLTLDPRYPLVWRTPDSLQLGVDEPPVVLESVTLGHERMLSALSIGLTPAGLTLIGTESGLTVAQVEDFHRRVQPALIERRERPRARVAITGIGTGIGAGIGIGIGAHARADASPSPTIDRLVWRLEEAGLEPHLIDRHPVAGKPDANKPDAGTALHSVGATDFAIIVAHYVLDPEVRGMWLRRDIPHLPIVFGDTSVTIGPMIEPGIGPCLYCLELHHKHADPAWPALASQLLRMRSTAETPFLASEVATIATRLILTRLLATDRAAPPVTASAPAPAPAPALRLDAETGEQTRWLHSRHPDCACGGIADVSAPVLREIGTARSRQNAVRSMPPTTTGAVSVPA